MFTEKWEEYCQDVRTGSRRARWYELLGSCSDLTEANMEFAGKTVGD